ncbi:hypothetical protein [Pseudorhodoferax sp.]|uniref:hypothetical protein n=1 Tax=Pseudorhodoferax sp. TaxID=1993553 RepID=UPI002DD63235|nr:hypothetical protein [Pseudorhodoferax sp.]
MQSQHSTPSSNIQALSGTALDAYLDDIESTLALQQEAGVAQDLQQTAVRDLLQRQAMRADTLRAVARLSQLWTQAGEPAEAVRVVEADGAQVQAELPASEQVDAGIRLGFWRIHALAETNTPEGRAALQQDLVGMERRLAGQPPAVASDELWQHLTGIASTAGLHDCVRRCAQARRARCRALPERAAYAAYDDAVLALRLADAFAAEGRSDDARLAGQQAFDALSLAAPDQDVDHVDWLRLGRTLLRHVPEHADALAGRVLAGLPADMGLAGRSDVQVQLNRLRARVLQQQGQHDAALALAWQGRYALDGDDDDGYSIEVIDWLLAAGQVAQAAALAYECVDNERPGSAEHACRLALQFEQAHAAPDPWWILALARAATQEDNRWVCRDEDASAYHARQIERARALAAAAPPADRDTFEAAVAALQAAVLLEQRRDLPAALTLLEFALRQPSQASSANVLNLWCCRVLRYGAAQALRLPFVPCSAAVWNYNVGVLLDRQVREVLPEGADWPQDDAQAVVQRHYEQGLAQFEAFFACGSGRYKDSQVHAYSMLCNNLAIRLYNLAKTPKQALATALPLHHKGIAASSFAEHYEGVLRCHRYADDLPNIVLAADALWHYAADHGYGRHEPSDYVGVVARALRDLDRKLEIGLWLQRLDSWWDGLDQDDRAEAKANYLSGKMQVLAAQAGAQPDDVRAHVQALVPQVQALGDADVTRLAGLALEESGAHGEALRVYRLAQAQLQPGSARDDKVAAGLRAGIKSCTKALRPWWRFWG